MKYKLAYLCGTNSWGGLEMNQLRNALWMKERQHDVLIFCQKGSPIEKNALESGIDVRIIKKHRKYYDVVQGSRLVRIIKQEGITHLIVRATYDMSIAAYAKWRMGNRLHLSYFMEMQLGISKRNLLHTFRFRWFDLWFCPLHWLAKQVSEKTKFPKKRIRVVPSGLDLQQFKNKIPIAEARDMLNLPKEEFLFGLIGRFDVNKGQLLLLDAMRICENKDFSVVLLGEPTRNEGDAYFDEMKQKINEAGLQDRVFILPFRKDIAVFYNAINCFVMASKGETFGMVTIEAMACGTQILGSNSGGTPEILQYGKLGLLFETMNSADLAMKMKEVAEGKILSSPTKLIQMANYYDHRSVCAMVEKELGLKTTGS